LNATANVPGTFAYNPTNGTVLTAGNNQTLSVTFTPTDTTNYSNATATVAINVQRATPVITWANPAAIIYGTALGSGQLNASTGVSGGFAYSPAIGTVLNAGATTLTVILTPFDTLDYTSATNTVSLVVSRAPLTVTASNASRPLGQTNPIFAGTVTGVTNGDNITAAYGCGATISSPAGPYAITPALVDPANSQTNYTVNLVGGTLTVTAPPVVSIAWLRSTLDPVNFAPTNTNSLFTATGVVSTRTNMTAPGNIEFYIQDATAGIAVYWSSAPAGNLPAAGSIVQVTAPLADMNGLLDLAPGFTNPLHSVTVLGATNLPVPQILPFDANITGNPAIMVQQLQGSYFVISNVYLDLSAGPVFGDNASEPLTNTDNLDFALNLFNPASLTAGTNYSVGATNEDGETFTIFYNDQTDILGQTKPTGPLIIYGVLGQFVASVPYTSGYQFIPSRFADMVSLGQPTVTWTNPASIISGTALGSNQLNAAANAPGAFAYNPPAGTILAVGSNQTLSVTFTPSDTVDYTNVTATVSINVQPAPASIGSVSLKGANLVINGVNLTVGSSYQCIVLSSPDMTLPVAQWTPVATNGINADGTFSFTNVMTGSQRAMFYTFCVTNVGP
jgi:hypothetical protein